MVNAASDCTMRSFRRHSGSRTLHLAYCSQRSSSSEQAITRTGPSIASITSATEIRAASRARW